MAPLVKMTRVYVDSKQIQIAITLYSACAFPCSMWALTERVLLNISTSGSSGESSAALGIQLCVSVALQLVTGHKYNSGSVTTLMEPKSSRCHQNVIGQHGTRATG